MMNSKACYFIADPNGSGKSTLAEELLLSQSEVIAAGEKNDFVIYDTEKFNLFTEVTNERDT